MTSENKIRVVYKAPGAEAEVREIPNTLKAFREAVGGFIHTVTIVSGSSDAVVIRNEQGRWLGLPYNCKLCGVEFVGPILVVGLDRDEFTSLSKTAAEFWMGALNRGM